MDAFYGSHLCPSVHLSVTDGQILLKFGMEESD
jgi:hypothetical protein